METITPDGVMLTTQDGASVTLTSDTVMVIEEDKANHQLYNQLKEMVPEIHIIGDASQEDNRWLEGTINDAVRAGMAV